MLRESISIHALHEESDFSVVLGVHSAQISIHALHEESDPSMTPRLGIFTFQSTLSMRRATHAFHATAPRNVFQSTLSMRRATLGYLGIQSSGTEFQSTLSMRRATHSGCSPSLASSISIHALHEESDSAAGHFCPLFETQASCLALSISNNTADTTNNMSKTSNWLSVSF